MSAALAPVAAGARRTESRRALAVVDPALAFRTVLRVDDFNPAFFLLAPVFAIGFLTAGLTPAVAALLVGGTFMVITMLAMQEARARVEGDATAVLGQMTAGFAFGQLMGPVISSVVGRFTPDFSTALNFALDLSALGLMVSAFYLWRVGRHPAY